MTINQLIILNEDIFSLSIILDIFQFIDDNFSSNITSQSAVCYNVFTNLLPNDSFVNTS